MNARGLGREANKAYAKWLGIDRATKPLAIQQWQKAAEDIANLLRAHNEIDIDTIAEVFCRYVYQDNTEWSKLGDDEKAAMRAAVRRIEELVKKGNE